MPSARAALLAVACAAGAVQASAAAPPWPAEPLVRVSVVEDRAVRIDELRVRGQLTRVTVRIKGEHGSTYHIVPVDGARDLGPQRGTAGQRMWSVLSF